MKAQRSDGNSDSIERISVCTFLATVKKENTLQLLQWFRITPQACLEIRPNVFDKSHYQNGKSHRCGKYTLQLASMEPEFWKDLMPDLTRQLLSSEAVSENILAS